MRPQLRSSFEVAHLLDEVQSLLLQYDHNAYTQRQEMPIVAGPQADTSALKSSDQSAQVEDMTMDASHPRGSEPYAAEKSAVSEYIPAGRLTGSAREERLAQIRAQIAAGTYDDEDRFEKALDRMFERIER